MVYAKQHIYLIGLLYDWKVFIKFWKIILRIFFEPQSLKIRSDHKAIIDFYGVEFMHDLPTIQDDELRSDWPNFILKASEKYSRRIDRFHTTVTSSEKIYFIRHYGIDKSSAIQLRDFIYKKYPWLDFTLVVVNPFAQSKQDWQLERIRNFYLDDSIIWNDPAQ